MDRSPRDFESRASTSFTTPARTTSRGETFFYHIFRQVSRDLEVLGHHALRF